MANTYANKPVGKKGCMRAAFCPVVIAKSMVTYCDIMPGTGLYFDLYDAPGRSCPPFDIERGRAVEPCLAICAL